jgi:AraC-like DNA-binding protein
MIEYQEYSYQDLEKYCMCIWTMKSKKIVNHTIYNHILPDDCIDLVIDFTRKEICFAGFSKETVAFPLNQKIDYMGVRFKPGAFYFLFHLSCEEVMDQKISFHSLSKEENLDVIFDLDASLRISYLKSYLLSKVNISGDLKYIRMVEELYQNPKNMSVLAISKRLGYHERHLYRLFKTNYGVSPKVLLNILSLHFCITLMLEEDKELLDIANLCGFYDQSHFIKEIKKYTGISPIKIIEEYH